MRKLYGVFHGTKWGMTNAKRTAIEAAKRVGGEVRSMRMPHDTEYWDMPTFYVCSDHVATFPAPSQAA